MAQSDVSAPDPVSAAAIAGDSHPAKAFWRRLLGRTNGGGPIGAADGPKGSSGLEPSQDDQGEDDDRPGLIRRVSRKVVPGLPRAQTFKRQQSELRDNLEPVQQTQAERRAVSVDRRLHVSQNNSQCQSNPRTSAPDFLATTAYSEPPSAPSVPSVPASPVHEKMLDSIGEFTGPAEPEPIDEPEPEPVEEVPHIPDAQSHLDTASMTTSQYDQMIHEDLERVWILNLSMHFRDKSKREKFFVTYRERETLWRRVTISLDYRGAPDNSLEQDLTHTKFQRDKNAKIYEAIRESLVDIQFYDTVTNLKLQTTDGRLHVHVVEDVNEIIQYPTTRMIQHLRCRRIRERDIEFDSHMSGFVYKVRVNGQVLIKKEIPGPDTVDEFLYEVNALNRLRASRNVIQFYGVIVDNNDEYVKGLLISYADQGALIDIIYDHNHGLPWVTREKWARQIIEGLSEIHEAGFVQGDFTLSNIVIDSDDNAKIIDINRRGCPVGWEPPEATPLIDSGQRISMYIGVKSDLYQLGMVLWALGMQEDEPENHGRPLQLDEDAGIPQWYRTIVETCLADDPRLRTEAIHLLHSFPGPADEWAQQQQQQQQQQQHHGQQQASSPVGGEGYDYFTDGYQNGSGPRIRTVQPPTDWSYVGHTYVDAGLNNEPYYYPTRGRSPPSPLPSNQGDSYHRTAGWAAGYGYGPSRGHGHSHGVTSPSYEGTQESRSVTTSTSRESLRGARGKTTSHAAAALEVPEAEAALEGRATQATPETDETPHAEEHKLLAGEADGTHGQTTTATVPQPVTDALGLGPIDVPQLVVEDVSEVKVGTTPVEKKGTITPQNLDSAAQEAGITAPEPPVEVSGSNTMDKENHRPAPPHQQPPEEASKMQDREDTKIKQSDGSASKEATSPDDAAKVDPAMSQRSNSPKLDELNGIGALHDDYLEARGKGSLADDDALTTTTMAIAPVMNQDDTTAQQEAAG